MMRPEAKENVLTTTGTAKTIDDTTPRPAFIDAGIMKYYRALNGLAFKHTKGNEDMAAILLTDTVIDCLTHWRSFRQDGGFYNWLKWRMRGKWSHMGVAQKRKNAVFNDFSIIDGVHDKQDDNPEITVYPSIPPSQETAVEVSMMLERIKGVKYSDDFCRILLGETLNEVAGGRCTNQAVNQRTRIARAIAAQGL